MRLDGADRWNLEFEQVFSESALAVPCYNIASAAWLNTWWNYCFYGKSWYNREILAVTGTYLPQLSYSIGIINGLHDGAFTAA